MQKIITIIKLYDKRDLKGSLYRTFLLMSSSSEYEEHLEVLEGGEDRMKNKISDTARKIALLKSNEAVLTRRYKAIEAQEKLLRNIACQLMNMSYEIYHPFFVSNFFFIRILPFSLYVFF